MKFILIFGNTSGVDLYTRSAAEDDLYVLPFECESKEKLTEYIDECVYQAVSDNNSHVRILNNNFPLNDLWSDSLKLVDRPHIYTMSEYGRIQEVE